MDCAHEVHRADRGNAQSADVFGIASAGARTRIGLAAQYRHSTGALAGLDELHKLTCELSARRAIEQARVYHGAALANFDGIILSRCNYDVAQGRDRSGRPYGGVLEQSWRMGGASAAEVAALEALCSDPTATVVHAAT